MTTFLHVPASKGEFKLTGKVSYVENQLPIAAVALPELPVPWYPSSSSSSIGSDLDPKEQGAATFAV